MYKEGIKGGSPDWVYYENKDHIENKQERALNKKYLNKKVKTKHGEGFVCCIDLPRSRAWSLMVKITEPFPEHVEMVNRFKERKLRYDLREITFL